MGSEASGGYHSTSAGGSLAAHHVTPEDLSGLRQKPIWSLGRFEAIVFLLGEQAFP